MKLDICKDFTVTPTATGLLVVTPLEYDDHDHIVVYADRQASGGWRVHDNGDAALRLMFDSIDPDAPRIQSWLAEHAGQVSWNERLAQLECADVPEESLVFAAFKVAQSAAQKMCIRDSNEKQADLHAWIKVRIPVEENGVKVEKLIETTVGRVLFNQVVPEEYGLINQLLTKKSIRDIIGDLLKKTGTAKACLLYTSRCV